MQQDIGIVHKYIRIYLYTIGLTHKLKIETPEDSMLGYILGLIPIYVPHP